jgi:23S rRNA (cytosine1962-C5)-methyltransferase
MDLRKELIVNAIADLFGEVTIVERNDAPVRRAEGLKLSKGVLRGNSSTEVKIDVDGLKFDVDLLQAQKTGFYLDQRENYRIVAQYARDQRVLDCFANQGAFALACARAGAAAVIGVDISSDSIEAAKRHTANNQLTVLFVGQDVFDFLRAAEKAKAEYDLIILDPPSFTKAKGGVGDALRGYRELHVRAFKLLSKNGVLATFSCSHHVSEAALAQTISDALVDTHRTARKLRRFEQAIDHPVLLTLPETEYFKGFLLEMMPGR